MNVDVLTGERVTEVSATGVKTATNREVSAELVVWAAGIKAPDFLKDIGGLETNRINQLVVEQTLQTTRDPEYLCLWRLRELSLAGKENLRAAACAFGAPAGFASGAAIEAAFDRERGRAMVLPGFRLSGVAWAVLRPWAN